MTEGLRHFAARHGYVAPSAFNQIISTMMSPGLMPVMRLVWLREAGRWARSFCRASMRGPALHACAYRHVPSKRL